MLSMVVESFKGFSHVQSSTHHLDGQVLTIFNSMELFDVGQIEVSNQILQYSCQLFFVFVCHVKFADLLQLHNQFRNRLKRQTNRQAIYLYVVIIHTFDHLCGM